MRNPSKMSDSSHVPAGYYYSNAKNFNLQSINHVTYFHYKKTEKMTVFYHGTRSLNCFFQTMIGTQAIRALQQVHGTPYKIGKISELVGKLHHSHCNTMNERIAISNLFVWHH